MPWEYELRQPISSLLNQKAMSSFSLEKPEYKSLCQKAIRIAKSSDQYSKEDFNEHYQKLVQEGVQCIINSNKDVMDLSQKMAKGSIVETNHIRTIDKA